ncbi:Rv3235 family protein [Streptomyces sp. NPDC023723]|uniref:Rv3235 family protein n=1 Tax=Streptomyces sp. NPDC023723 TaxID=3154323 RepID=UPI0033E701A2
MHKVMNRAQRRHPGSRPPGRHDSRRPAGAPPRGPGALPAARTAVPEDRPPGSTARPVHGRPGPRDSRPSGTPGSSPATGRLVPSRPDPAFPGRGPGRTDRPTPGLTPSTARATTAAPARTAGGAADQRPPAPAPVTRSAVLPVAARGTRQTVPQPRPTDLFAERLLAVLSGQRPVHSMLRHTIGQAYDDLAHLAARGPLRTRGTHPVVRDLGWFEPRPGAVEVFARIGAGDQLRAMAFRLECGSDLRWRCTAVELGGPRRAHGAGR